MKNKLFWTMTGLLVVLLLVLVTITTHVNQMAFAANAVKVTVDGELIDFDVPPYIDENDRTLVPIRFIAEELGADVSWDDPTDTVTIKHEDKEIQLVIGETQATVNGSAVTFDTAAVIRDGRTMVPVRFISETLGAKVGWESSTNTVVVETTEYIKQFEGLNWHQKIAMKLALEMQREIDPSIDTIMEDGEGFVYYSSDGESSNIYFSTYEEVFILTIKQLGDIEKKFLSKVLKEFYPTEHKKAFNMILDTWNNGNEYQNVPMDGLTYGSKRFQDGTSSVYIRGVQP